MHIIVMESSFDGRYQGLKNIQDPDPRPRFEKLLRHKSRLGAFDRDRDKTPRSKFKVKTFS